ncbi:MAG: glutamate--tRNA ligase [Gammaproteobacteria bacterium]|nr:glutamate--tRNA ligase [Gammaproteobacteria bacterium]
MHTVKTRFAPSPTGLIHLGNARTALFSALLAKHFQGTFLLRIEDTDLERSKEEYTLALEHDLCWMQCRWNEGPDIGGEYGPYWQSEREAIYNRYYKKLEELGRAYACFCSEEQLNISRKVQRIAGQAPRYAGTCRHLSESERQQKLAAGLKPVLRFQVDDGAVIEFEDLVKGKQKFLASDIGDFIIRRADGAPTFMFCNAIDDAFMHVTHVLRGEDHLTNTPRQLMILQALSLEAPIYGHISLILGSDGAPLSKRTGSKSIRELEELGWLSDSVLNYLARLGHYYVDNDFMSFQQLAEKFAINNLSSSSAKYDPQQMLYWQKTGVAQLSNDAFWHWISSDDQFSPDIIPAALRDTFIQAVKPNVIFPKDAWHWANIFFANDWLVNPAQEESLQTTNPNFFNTALAAADTHGADLVAVVNAIKENLGVKGKQLFMPLRIALTGEEHGPELALIGQLLGAEKIKQRLNDATLLLK